MMKFAGDDTPKFDNDIDYSERAQRLAAVGQYALGIAHDFSNVLTVVLANASVLGMQYPAQSEMPEELRDIMSSAQRGNEMIQRLMRFVRQEPLSIPPIPIDAVTEALPRQMRALLPRNVQLDFQCPSLPFLIRAEVSQIEQIVLNLVTNARDAMPNGGTIQLNVSVADHVERRSDDLPERTGAFVTIAIKDTGCGLDEATRRRMFEPFFTTKRSGKGLGIGLAMTQSLIRQLNGHIEVRTEAGSGTTVSVVLPVVAIGAL